MACRSTGRSPGISRPRPIHPRERARDENVDPLQAGIEDLELVSGGRGKQHGGVCLRASQYRHSRRPGRRETSRISSNPLASDARSLALLSAASVAADADRSLPGVGTWSPPYKEDGGSLGIGPRPWAPLWRDGERPRRALGARVRPQLVTGFLRGAHRGDRADQSPGGRSTAAGSPEPEGVRSVYQRRSCPGPGTQGSGRTRCQHLDRALIVAALKPVHGKVAGTSETIQDRNPSAVKKLRPLRAFSTAGLDRDRKSALEARPVSAQIAPTSSSAAAPSAQRVGRRRVPRSRARAHGAAPAGRGEASRAVRPRFLRRTNTGSR